MKDTRPVEDSGAMQARLRQVEELVVGHTRQPAAQAGDGGPSPATAVGPRVPVPRRVPVYLRSHPEEGGFAELTITHPVPPPLRRVPTT